jgi:hypothetical protein
VIETAGGSPTRLRAVGVSSAVTRAGKETLVLLIVGIVLRVIAVAGGGIIHPVLFVLGIVALVLFFQR